MHETDQDWRQRAACRDVDPNVMQPEVASPADVEAAMAHCVGCPVWDLCQQLAESQDHPYGIHAGRWYGDPPRDAAARPCAWCLEAVDPERSTAAYCSGRCRTAAYRARVAQAIPA